MVQFIVSSHSSPLCHCHIVVSSLYEHTVTFDAAETFKQFLSRSKLFKVDCVPSFLFFKLQLLEHTKNVLLRYFFRISCMEV